MRLIIVLALISLLVVIIGVVRVQQRIASAPELPPLARAARSGDTEAIAKLIEVGLDPNDIRGGRGWTPLMHAIHKNQMDSVSALLGGGAAVNQQNDKGLTSLMMAASYGATEVVELLLRHGADPYIANRAGLTALDFALLGIPDIDRFTAFRCQAETVAAIRQSAPELKARGALFDRTLLLLKSCDF